MFEALLLLLIVFLALPILSLVVTLIQRSRQAEWNRRVEALESRVAQMAAATTQPPVTPAAPPPTAPRTIAASRISQQQPYSCLAATLGKQV